MRERTKVITALWLAAMLATGCNGTNPAKPKKTGDKSVDGATGVDTVVDRTGPGVPTSAYTGRVLDLTGQPAANIAVAATLISSNGGNLVTDNGAGIISSNSGNVISSNGGNVVSSNGGTYRVLQAGLSTKTNAQGEFTLAMPTGQKFNVEAVESNTVKALRQEVDATTASLELKLAYTGVIQGKVTAPQDRQVTDFTGVDVYIPGTGYLAKTDAAGRYKLDNVPVGTYTLLASKTGLGSGRSEQVTVTPKGTVDAKDLGLALEPLTIKSVVPPNAAAGATVTITGENFGGSRGKPYQLRIGGVTIENSNRVGETSITFTVPSSLPSGPVIVAVDGLPSNSLPFQGLAGFTLNLPRTPLGIGAEQAVDVRAVDAQGEAIANPSLTWTISRGTAASVSATGLLKGLSAGTATLKVASGALVAETPLQIANPVAGAPTLAGTTSSLLTSAVDLAVDAAGTSVYLATSHSVLKYTPASGAVSLLAGAEAQDPDGEVVPVDGQGAAVRFEGIKGLAVRPDGSLYVIDGSTVRTLSTTGAVMTVAGSYDPDDSAEDSVAGPGVSAVLLYPGDGVMDSKGNLIFPDANGLCRMTPGFDVEHLSIGEEVYPEGDTLAIDASDNVYFADSNGLNRISPSGTVTVLGADSSDVYRVMQVAEEEETGEEPLDAEFEATQDEDEEEPIGPDADFFGMFGGTVAAPTGGFYASAEGYLFRYTAAGVRSVAAGNGSTTAQDGSGPTARFASAGRLAFGPGGVLYMADDATLRKITFADSVASVTTLLKGSGTTRQVKATLRKPAAAAYRH